MKVGPEGMELSEVSRWLRDASVEEIERALGAHLLLASRQDDDGSDEGWAFSTKQYHRDELGTEPALDVYGMRLFTLRKAKGTVFADTLLIGRASSNDICLPHQSVSKLHARIRVTGEGLFLSDADSQNGTWLEGGAVRQPTRIEQGNIIQIGAFALELVDPARLQRALLESPQ